MAKSAFTSKMYAEAHAENDQANEVFAMIETAPIDVTMDDEVAEVLAEVVANDELAEVLAAEDDAAIEALESGELVLGQASDETEAPADLVLDSEAPQAPVDFDAVLQAISDEAAIAMAISVGAQIDERQDFERAKGNDNIQKALAKARKQLATPSAARVLIACSVDPAMINRSVHEGVRYNVYALGKLADAIHGLSGGAVNNAINLACTRSLFRFKAAGKEFTGEMAKAAASDKIRVDTGLRGMLVRHTVSASTSSTQASSTMQALTTLGIVSRSGSHKNPTFTLTDTAVVAKLQRVIGEVAAAA